MCIEQEDINDPQTFILKGGLGWCKGKKKKKQFKNHMKFLKTSTVYSIFWHKIVCIFNKDKKRENTQFKSSFTATIHNTT